jgi:hypothetical protein
MDPIPSSFSKLMYPFQRKQTPFKMSGESTYTWKEKMAPLYLNCAGKIKNL